MVTSYNWPQAGVPTESCTSGCTSGALVAGTPATITLTPCPVGNDTSNNANAPYISEPIGKHMFDDRSNLCLQTRISGVMHLH